MRFSQLDEPYIEDVRNHVRNNRRAGASLRQTVLMAGNLSDYSCDLFWYCEFLILDEETPYSAKVERREEIVKIQIQNVSTVFMHTGIVEY
jgi:hypothetical protein